MNFINSNHKHSNDGNRVQMPSYKLYSTYILQAFYGYSLLQTVFIISQCFNVKLVSSKTII